MPILQPVQYIIRTPNSPHFSTNLSINIAMIFESFMTFLSKVLFFSGMVKERSSFPRPLSKSDEENYMRQFQETGDLTAKEILIKHNLRLVAHVVKKYNGAAEADDLISCGTIGLIKAINSFKLEKGTQVSTYAARCIENEILMFLRVSKKHQNTGSLNECLGNDRDGNELVLSDIIPNDGGDPIDLEQHQIMLRRLIAKMREKLSEREYKIISLRYGIDNQIALPQREVASMMGISRSYISRIEKQAIQIIRELVATDEFANALNTDSTR